MQETITNKIITLKGIVKFPQWELDGGFSCKLCLDDSTIEEVENEIEPIGEELAVKEMQDEKYRNGINVKSRFEFPIFDKVGNSLIDSNTEEPKIYDGAKVLMRINFKKYEYEQKQGRRSFKRTGVTGYLLGCVVIEQGVRFESSTTFEDFRQFLAEDIQL